MSRLVRQAAKVCEERHLCCRRDRVEFKEHGLDGVITVKHRDVYKDGFELDNEVDASKHRLVPASLLSLRKAILTCTISTVFLDLPAPWEALEHAKKAMRVSRKLSLTCP